MLSSDPAVRAALGQSLETALAFAELSDGEAAAFRERAIGETRVVRRHDGRYWFEQPARTRRRTWRWTELFRFFISSSPSTMAPPEGRAEIGPRTAFVRLLGVLAAIWLLIRGVRIFDEAVVDGGAPIQVGMALVGMALVGVAALLLWRLAVRYSNRDRPGTSAGLCGRAMPGLPSRGASARE